MTFTLPQQQLIDALSDLRGILGDVDYAEAIEAAKSGEPGLALEIICQQLFEFDTRVPASVYTKLAAAGRAMNMPERNWKILETLVDG